MEYDLRLREGIKSLNRLSSHSLVNLLCEKVEMIASSKLDTMGNYCFPIANNNNY